MSTRPMKARVEKVQAQYRLPQTLADEIKIRAVRNRVRPCVLVERLLKAGLDMQQSPAIVDIAAS